MSRASFRLGTALGVPVSMDPAVLLVGALLTWSLADGVLPRSAPGHVSLTYWSVAALGALGFLAALLAHELAHCVVARRHGIEVEGITLWMLGGFAEFGSQPKSPGAEFQISAAGPAASLAVALVSGGAAYGLSAVGIPAVYVAVLAWLAVLNALLFVFNLLPGAPLDGGRILAAVIWKVRGDEMTGRLGATVVGRVMASLLVGLGVFQMLSGSTAGLWTVLVGWFMFSAASGEQRMLRTERALGDVRVAQVMSPSPQVAHSWTTVSSLVEGPLRRKLQSAVPVLDARSILVGVVSMADVQRLPAAQWSTRTVAELLDGRAPATVTEPCERVADLLERAGLAEPAVVLQDGAVVGIVGAEEVRRAVAEPGDVAVSSPPPVPSDAPRQDWHAPV